MTQTLHTNASSIADAFYALSLERRVPNADVLDDIVRRYPEHATQLTEFVIDLVLDGLHDTVTESNNADGATDDLGISPAVSRAMSRFQNHLHSIKKADEAGAEHKSLTGRRIETFNPFSRLNREEFRKLVVDLDASSVFVTKLRDRQIDPEGMTNGFREEVAEKLNVPTEVLVEHFAAPVAVVSAGGQFFRAIDKPSVGNRQSFEEAVRSSGLSGRQQKRLTRL